MSPEDSPLLDILAAAKHACGFVANVTEREFSASLMHQYAVSRALEIIGEASKKVPEEARVRYPALPWPKMVALRNRLIHEYGDVKPAVLWEIVHRDLPDLIAAIEPHAEEPPE